MLYGRVPSYEKVLQLNKDFPKAYFLKGVAIIKTGNRKEGFEYIKKASDMGDKQASLFLEARGKRKESGKDSFDL